MTEESASISTSYSASGASISSLSRSMVFSMKFWVSERTMRLSGVSSEYSKENPPSIHPRTRIIVEILIPIVVN
ncbi:hypothetical protein MT325_m698R [Paramecium bursaria chlorella virus MT325]|uniref:Uncharacterized protein m698R n=2 Tax=Paramecium bursaria Chlorella virus A1 TaxID=381899 RepID=A7IV78_PBCVM|nr:hypothetical protein FR483_n688R [Paramecium bursaria Chlorella virus FR483]ABT14252.1 hypothetical protein MT325_m698R [Paramecium bursaria chlorella virus MT325]ABT15973.1 hypothetical protein FR483_n688R [Paramecium bursaria Chlorella virus FR483]